MLAALALAQMGPFPPGTTPQIPFEAVMIARSFFTTVAVILLGIPIIRSLSRRFIERPPVAPGLPADVTARLERIEQAVDSIAIEVERISEAQRFTTKLLTQPGNPLSAGRAALPPDASR